MEGPGSWVVIYCRVTTYLARLKASLMRPALLAAEKTYNKRREAHES